MTQKDTKVLQLHFAKIAILVIFNVKGLSQKRGAISKKGWGLSQKGGLSLKGFILKSLSWQH